MTSLLSPCLCFKHFPGRDTSSLNEVMNIKYALAQHQPLFFSVFFFFFQLANDFNIHKWVKWVKWVDATFFSPLGQTRGNAWELPVGRRRPLRDPRQVCSENTHFNKQRPRQSALINSTLLDFARFSASAE